MGVPSDLLELQSVDVEILRAKKRLDELPEKLAILEMRTKIRETVALKSKAEMLVRKLEAEIKARQDEIDMLKAKLGQEQAKVMATTDHRAVQSITREMDGLKRRCDKLDNESLQYMERADKARSQVAAIETHVAKLSEKEAALVERFKQVGSGVQDEIASLESRRTRLAGALPADLLERYEALRASKNGVGVGRLDGATCSACRMSLPAERINDLQHGDDVGVCPQCRRLLVVRNAE